MVYAHSLPLFGIMENTMATERQRVVVRRVAPAMTKAGRKLGSLGVVTPRMLAFSAARLAGASDKDAAALAGYKSEGRHVAARLDQHPGLVEMNRKMFEAAGLTPEKLAARIVAGTDAEHTIAVSVLKEDGAIIGKELIKEPEWPSRQKFMALAAGMMGMTPEANKTISMTVNTNTTKVDVTITEGGLENLTGEALLAEYKRRMAMVASGELKGGEFLASIVGAATVDRVDPEHVAARVRGVHERVAEAVDQGGRVASGSNILFDPASGEVVEVVEAAGDRKDRSSDPNVRSAVQRVARTAVQHREKFMGKRTVKGAARNIPVERTV